MSNVPTAALPPGQANNLAVLLDALDGVAISDGERASLAWLAGFGVSTVENVATVLTPRPTADSPRWTADRPPALISIAAGRWRHVSRQPVVTALSHPCT
jgi:hypothetical protein